MARNGIQYSDVQQAIDTLLSRGDTPSVQRIRDVLGTGSFTTISEQGQPEEIVQMLNEYFTKMVAIVFRHHGTVDKFVGDMIMALYGAPLDDDQHAEHAVQTSLAFSGAVVGPPLFALIASVASYRAAFFTVAASRGSLHVTPWSDENDSHGLFCVRASIHSRPSRSSIVMCSS